MQCMVIGERGTTINAENKEAEESPNSPVSCSC